MKVEIKTPAMSDKTLKVRISAKNSFSDKKAGILITSSVGVYNYRADRWMKKYSDDVDNDKIGKGVNPGEKTTHNMELNLPPNIGGSEADLLISVWHTENIGSYNLNDYTLADRRAYKIDIEPGESVLNMPQVLTYVVGGALTAILVKG